MTRALHANRERQGWRFQTSRFFYRRYWRAAKQMCRIAAWNYFFAAANKMCCVAARKIGWPALVILNYASEKRQSDGALGAAMPVEISDAGFADEGQVRLISIASRTNSAYVRTP